ncbi:protein RESISTANCE TO PHYTOPHTHORA 1, chloroplastic-like [Neltuma alba]|uniref:protein RESISTANCE TO PHYTOPHTHORA 1, chloroplastic-like n=1 Tax=Neltuma alba TaxID=207710 RepID=UPI0010A457C0|nr:protein RESISTANCE TO PHYTOPHTHORA 1, chloroplastic-like [Prosopis alba]
MSLSISTPPGSCHASGLHVASPVLANIKLSGFHSIPALDRTNLSRSVVRYKVSPRATSDETNTQAVGEQLSEELKAESTVESTVSSRPASSASIDKDIKKVVQKTASTFAPRASTASKNPAVPGTALYTVFEVQGYASMLLGGALSFNLLFPSNEPDIWRLMGMWSIWMFTIPSLRARDCSKNEKEALNYLFLLIPLLNVAIPFFWKSFAVVWTADTIAFFGMYAWKFGWLQRTD